MFINFKPLKRTFLMLRLIAAAGFTSRSSGADLGGGCRGCAPPPEMTCGFLIQLVFCKKKTMWFFGVEVEQETSAPSLVARPVRATRVTRGGLEPSAIVLGEFSRQASQVTSHPKSPRTTGNEAGVHPLLQKNPGSAPGLR